MSIFNFLNFPQRNLSLPVQPAPSGAQRAPSAVTPASKLETELVTSLVKCTKYFFRFQEQLRPACRLTACSEGADFEQADVTITHH
ncbi:hypothetical protein ETAA8_03400 [Anatilimnocola aggregata]|uniref:Uncharacterized protein n=1 Tax=Anatilimnocola aggregata TaxID=2528021 RepID=A0A517Y502_9BACT|nr:hypothetical protein ETAA8_03400 [Anatilimnocola aggregata]